MCLSISGDRFEYETGMCIKAAQMNSITEIPIHTVYYEENKGTHFHPLKDSFRIYKLLFQTFLTYSLVALSSFVLDIALFALCSKYILAGCHEKIVFSTVCARILSATYNYLMNRNYVFKSKRTYSTTAIQYLILCIVQMSCSAFLVRQITALTKGSAIVLKILVDTLLFLLSYLVQKKLIFKGGNEHEIQNKHH